MPEPRLVTVIAVKAKPDSVLRAAAQWEQHTSDPLLSEFTRMTISGPRTAAWVSQAGDGVVTLVPANVTGSGLVEVAAQSPDIYPGVWAELHADVLLVSARLGFSRLEVIDRHSSLQPEGARVLDGVRRMKSNQIDTPTGGSTSSYEDSDFDEVLAVIRSAFAGHPENGDWRASDVTRRMAEPWFAADGLRLRRDGSRLVGLCWCKIHADGVGEIYLLAVRPEYEGKGHGRELALGGIDYLRRKGCADFLVYSAADNEAALKLYQSVGFVTDRIERRLEFLLGYPKC